MMMSRIGQTPAPRSTLVRCGRVECHAMDSLNRAAIFGERHGAVERIAPGFCEPALEADHMARYRWAAQWVRGCIVLDAASGTGYGAEILRAAGARAVVSVDRSRLALRFGSRRYDLRPV